MNQREAENALISAAIGTIREARRTIRTLELIALSEAVLLSGVIAWMIVR